MKAKSKLRIPSNELDFSLREFDQLKTCESVERVKSARWELHAKVYAQLEKVESEETRRALRLALSVIMDEIQALAALSDTKRQLENPHVAWCLALESKVEELKNELESAARRERWNGERE